MLSQSCWKKHTKASSSCLARGATGRAQCTHPRRRRLLSIEILASARNHPAGQDATDGGMARLAGAGGASIVAAGPIDLHVCMYKLRLHYIHFKSGWQYTDTLILSVFGYNESVICSAALLRLSLGPKGGSHPRCKGGMSRSTKHFACSRVNTSWLSTSPLPCHRHPPHPREPLVIAYSVA